MREDLKIIPYFMILLDAVSHDTQKCFIPYFGNRWPGGQALKGMCTTFNLKML